jgi:hypothetical protein
MGDGCYIGRGDDCCAIDHAEESPWVPGLEGQAFSSADIVRLRAAKLAYREGPA